MCGIFGMFSIEGNVNIETLIKATKVLKHRGPDGTQHWLSENKKMGFGHTRLSIIDIEGGTQPLHNEDGTIHAVVNGEIYDFERIRSILQARGHRFTTLSDSEVLLHLYEESGIDALNEIRGEYAFIIWDERTNQIIAGRDRFGIKPLYYSFHNNSLYLGSEIKALLAAGVPAYWDEESYFTACHFGFIPLQGRSLFKDVFQVPPGHVLISSSGNFKIQRYWDFEYPVDSSHNFDLSDSDAIDKFRNLFEESVKLRLRADVPVGIYLSGGLDSCSILGTAAKFKGSGIKAFTICFEDVDYDDGIYAKEMAQYAGAEYEPLLVTQQSLADNFISSVIHGETAIFNPHSVAKFMLSKSVSNAGFKVVLTGEGSDEILAGYPHFRQDLLRYSQKHSASFDTRKELENLKKNNSTSQGWMMSTETAEFDNAVMQNLGYTPSWLTLHINNSKRIKRFQDKSFVKRFSDVDAYSSFLSDFDIPQALEGRHKVNQSLYLWSKIMLPNYLLTNLGDRMEMGHSIEGRVPFLDHHLVEFAASLPVSLKIRGMTEKYILREAVRPVITNTIYTRQKNPFIAPPSTVNKNPALFKFVSGYIEDNIDKLPFYNKTRIRLLLKTLKFMPKSIQRDADSLITMLASLLALQENFRIKMK